MPLRANQSNDYLQTAKDVMEAIGGSENVIASDVCMTRLRLSLEDASRIDLDHLNRVRSGLGVMRRSEHGYDVIFGPSVIDGVYRDFVELSGSGAGSGSASDAIDPKAPRRSEGPMSVTITNDPAEQDEADEAPVTHAAQDADEPDEGFSELMDRLAAESQTSPSWNGVRGRRVLVVNGPNINLLGMREPRIYGNDSYQDLVDLCRKAAIEAGFESCRCFQSNHEGDIVDEIQAAFGTYDGIVINPAAYTHTSVAILDAIKAVRLPTVEVHISQVELREDFRQGSYVREACFETITGMGIQGYRKAILDLADHLRSPKDA